MVKLKSIFQSDLMAAIEIAAEYKAAYSETDFIAFPAIAFPLISAFEYSAIRQCTGHSPYEYLTRLRIEHAKSMLAQGISVTETAFNTGFNSIENFSFAFSRQEGYPPSLFKNSRIS